MQSIALLCLSNHIFHVQETKEAILSLSSAKSVQAHIDEVDAKLPNPPVMADAEGSAETQDGED